CSATRSRRPTTGWPARRARSRSARSGSSARRRGSAGTTGPGPCGGRGAGGAFAICSLWLVSALAEIGEHDRARALCEKMLGFASSLNLYAEEIDAASGRHLGNFPQAFTHLALINAVVHVIRADHELAASQPLMESRRAEVTVDDL